MRHSYLAAASLCLGLLALGNSVTAASDSPSDPPEHLWSTEIARRGAGEHHHGNHHAQPLLALNETELLRFHQPTPPSYYTIDWEGDGDSSVDRHPGLMVAHAILMSLAFFVALPIGIILRSLRHPARVIATISFYGLATLGISSSKAYRKVTPNMYEGSVHGKQGYLIMLVTVLISAVDFVQNARRVLLFSQGENKTFKHFWRFVILQKDDDLGVEAEYTGLIVEDPEEFDFHKLQRRESDETQVVEEEGDEWVNGVQRHRRISSHLSEATIVARSNSDDTLNEIGGKGVERKKKGWATRLTGLAISGVEYILVVAGMAELLVGIVVYTGGCRQNWINGCLAHLIKGGIFWCYGLLTFGRFLGAFATRGWAWNRPTRPRYSAEFVESFVIFLYGATNTWMERFGAHPGDPFTTKQIQHISIAVMFWFAGLVGMGIESRQVRRWLASSALTSGTSREESPQNTIAEPPSYTGSFNPFPALVIGVTGAAMAAHFQTYLFQVQIHSLWGNLLVGFSVLRCLTYFFLWLAPPKSILPSRPPTEALGSFFLACGGLVFMFSTEELTIAAMRRGRDDVMMFLNVAVAITCLAFCWTLFVVGLKGYLKSRARSSMSYRSTSA
ncbi:cytoplasmic protein [Coprinopsis sp. MPI-PUGE-AT-0042]|nr:cytoplasmic protein [Coprinopsis sp. MPI-PUGE-AT-0042]